MKLQTVCIQGAAGSFEKSSSALMWVALHSKMCALRQAQRLTAGFKSFRDEVVVGPFTSGLSCIIGANGYGVQVPCSRDKRDMKPVVTSHCICTAGLARAL